MNKGIALQLLRIPTNAGTIVAYIEGFQSVQDKGTVFAELNGKAVTASGFNRKKTIVRAIAKLHQQHAIQQDFTK
ncbi:hypothetical protein [Jeotgalibacillus aurantiacus]|uniref:hypothetical protein n=1 Tax=Jeotgalibacillus aurantiacus TaxID=2763266 RepID=UPI001D09CAF7|nr:hypothetical protein [Jeotgalibacillus aurantiacus]